ncbi:hypothetical protein D9M69_551840 [compost metagenome]
MGKIQCQRHIVICFTGSIPEHHPLVSGTLCIGSRFKVVFRLPVYALIDVLRLLVNGRYDPTGVGFKHVFRLGIADLPDHLAGNRLNIEVSSGVDFSCQYHQTGSYQGFTSYFGIRIEGQKMVNKGVRYLVSNFVRMPFGNGFRSK